MKKRSNLKDVPVSVKHTSDKNANPVPPISWSGLPQDIRPKVEYAAHADPHRFL